MTKQLSFSKYENQAMPSFRDKTNMAESTEDVKKFFRYTTQELFTNIFEGQIEITQDDIVLSNGDEPYFTVSERLLALDHFTSVWNSSDLPRMTGRLAKTAMNRCRHLEKHPEKTNSKIRM
ncbi:MAG: hypothetical protein OEY01_04735 [Desulfobulbaceae bacterium]|nr:hypothetical protein [Desulfobulbaceae bacterium]HIJ78479.1 hypothetical protein [Deltaproteobacteria bacterium]